MWWDVDFGIRFCSYLKSFMIFLPNISNKDYEQLRTICIAWIVGILFVFFLNKTSVNYFDCIKLNNWCNFVFLGVSGCYTMIVVLILEIYLFWSNDLNNTSRRANITDRKSFCRKGHTSSGGGAPCRAPIVTRAFSMRQIRGSSTHNYCTTFGASIFDSSSSCKQPLRNSSSVRWPSPFSSIRLKMFFARSSAESVGFVAPAPNMS